MAISRYEGEQFFAVRLPVAWSGTPPRCHTATMTIIRNCGAGDYAKVLEIYNHYVEHSHTTFDLHRFSVGERVPWFSQFAETGAHQLLVADRDGEVAGYCSSTQFRHKPAYDVSVETTVYVSPAALHEGIGKKLYDELLDRLKAAGIHSAFAGIALPNDASIALHKMFGFTEAGTWQEVGYKFDRFVDVAWFEKRLADA